MQNISTGRVKLTRESTNSQTQQSVHTTLENDRCKSGLNIYFTTKCIQLGATWCYHSSENWTGLGLTWLPWGTSDSKTKRSSAQRGSDTNLTGPILFSTQSEVISLDKDAETEKNPWVSMAQNGSLQHVSKCLSLHMNIKKYIRVPGRSSPYSSTDMINYKHDINIEKKNIES
jgi:hypothetical protein